MVTSREMLKQGISSRKVHLFGHQNLRSILLKTHDSLATTGRTIRRLMIKEQGQNSAFLPPCTRAPFRTNVLSLRTDDGSYSGITSPDPPASMGKSFNLGSPSFIGSTVSA